MPQVPQWHDATDCTLANKYDHDDDDNVYAIRNLSVKPVGTEYGCCWLRRQELRPFIKFSPVDIVTNDPCLTAFQLRQLKITAVNFNPMDILEPMYAFRLCQTWTVIASFRQRHTC